MTTKNPIVAAQYIFVILKTSIKRFSESMQNLGYLALRKYATTVNEASDSQNTQNGFPSYLHREQRGYMQEKNVLKNILGLTL